MNPSHGPCAIIRETIAPVSFSMRAGLACAIFIAAQAVRLVATCPGCTEIGPPVSWGTLTSSGLSEASGLAVSRSNPGVIWTHNDDGADGRSFAYSTNGVHLATFNRNLVLGDVEDMALGPGPVVDVSYLYLGDIGGAGTASGVRNAVTIVRIPEPGVSLTWAGNPRSFSFLGAETFRLEYPDGSYEAEALMVDSITGDLFVATKQNFLTRVYRANLNTAENNATIMLQFAASVPFPLVSGGAISANGGRIVLRRENAASMWIRCDGETVGDALARAGVPIPLVGPPTEPNGEAIAFLPDGTGYLTISDRADTGYQPPVYFFPALCSLTAPGTEIVAQPQSANLPVGSDVQFAVAAAGANLTYQWLRNGVTLPGANTHTFSISNVQLGLAGSYTVLVSGDGGAVLSTPAVLTVLVLPPVLIRQPESAMVATGATVQLSVDVQGTPPFSYAWTRSGRKLASTDRILMLTNVQRSSAGAYRVTVTNVMGKAISTNAVLKVLKPPVIVVQPQPRTVTAGSDVVLRLRATGSPPKVYQWMFNGAPLPGATTPRLVLRDVSSDRSGGYSVVVSNAVGTATSLVAEVVVQ